ncbi:MAG: hypothetical protein DMG57_23920 [Acidobacteria bacterium]|nr:MAG: hypothetical protein DMG57_23920 [Acidobacteriota bacterium]
MPEVKYRGRRASSIENNSLRVTVLHEGGHIAEILDKSSGVNPLWTPPWPSIEPSTYNLAKHPEYGRDSESKLLAGIMGHNLCLDFFGGPSDEEAAAGLTVHGEASVAQYQVATSSEGLTQRAELPVAQLRLEREIRFAGDREIEVRETLENLSASDRPIGWTEHVTLGPPFLERGQTQFRASATKSKVSEGPMSDTGDYQKPGAEFDWPNVPRMVGGSTDLRVYNSAPVSAGFTTHMMDPHREHAYFVAFSPASKMAFGYVWRRADFPWLGIWEENHSRSSPPWNKGTLTRGMEFGASPMPESRRKMIDRGTLFGMPGFRWIPAKSRVHVVYRAMLAPAGRVPEALTWSGDTTKFE